MGSVEAEHAEKLHGDIRDACGALEEIGYDSLVIIASKEKHMTAGSLKGIWFLEENHDCIRDFIYYCRDDRLVSRLQHAYELEQPVVQPSNMETLVLRMKTESKIERHTGTADQSTNQCVNSPKPDTTVQEIEPEESADDVQSEEVTGDTQFMTCNVIPKSNIIIIGNVDLQKDDLGNTHSKTTSLLRKGKGMKNLKSANSQKTQKVRGEKRSVPNQAGMKNFECDLCDKKYVHLSDLTIHRRKHTGETPYSCEVCSKKFRSQCLLRAHGIAHSTAMPYVCDVCGQLFARPTSLRRHRAIHSDKNPYVCDFCGRGFKDQSNFKMHKLRHTGQKPFCCETCGKAFWRADNLASHIRVHTGEKPFACDICGQMFRQTKNLATHKRRRHNTWKQHE